MWPSGFTNATSPKDEHIDDETVLQSSNRESVDKFPTVLQKVPKIIPAMTRKRSFVTALTSLERSPS